MNDESIRIFPLGDSALTVEFGNAISISLNDKAIALARYFDQHPFRGYIESVPSYSSTTIFYDLVAARREFPEAETTFDGVRELVSKALKKIEILACEKGRSIEIPVDFSEEFVLDLQHVAMTNHLLNEEVISIFTSREYRVFMLGFLPGFSYMGELDERIATPRKETPRTLVPKGSVAIAGRQTGVYSIPSPGGWQIIGRTELKLFRPEKTEPSLLRAGDIVRFTNAK